jgi:hypothetical protein
MLCLISFFITIPTQCLISIVYNLRVAETSKRLIIESSFEKPSLAAVTLFGTFRQQYNGARKNSGGGLFTLLYAPEYFFLRVDGAIGRVTLNDHGIRSGRTQTDDLLFSAGYSPRLSDKIRLTFSGLLGFPTHDDTSIERIQFGTGHYALGVQLDGAVAYSSNKDNTLRFAARFIHFFPRNVFVPINARREQFKFGLGDLTDLFIAFHHQKGQHSVEAGYNPSFFFDTTICPRLDDVLQEADYIRNSFYGLYKYHFAISQTTHAIALALSYGFDIRPKTVGNKRIITTWASWIVNF